MKRSLLLLIRSAWVVLICASAASAALAPDEIALIVNRAAPEGVELAAFYARARGIPVDRVIQLDLPNTDEMPFDQYDRDVVPTVRQFLHDRGLEQKVRCLVTFYGVPLRIADRTSSPRDKNELAQLTKSAQRITDQINARVTDAEKRAAAVDATFKPPSTEPSAQALAIRLQRAMQTIERAGQQSSDPAVQRDLAKYMTDMIAWVTAPVNDDDAPATNQVPTSAPSQAPAELEKLVQQLQDPTARESAREQARRSLGIFGYWRVLQAQIDHLTPEGTGAAFDNELALLWWPPYKRASWQPNPLNPVFREMRMPRAVMVMRLDAPTPQIVRDIVTNSMAVEREGGLKGKLVVDAQGLGPLDASGKPDGKGMFDARLRKLAAIVKEKSSIPVLLDDKPEVLPPNSVDDVALYCGWYSLRAYVPAMKFNRGAVGYHVASFELVSLRNPGEPGWVAGLLRSGVVATVGPVAEPFLHSFPNPDDFFPLLMTGKLTLAETYWTTTPLTSWMLTCIGDPLYRPYATNPAMKVEDLPGELREVMQRQGDKEMGRQGD